MRFKIDWAILIVICFCFVLLCISGQFSKNKFPGAYIWRDDLTEGFLRYRFGGLLFGGAYNKSLYVYIHRGAYFRNFTVVITLRAEVRGTRRQMHSKQCYKLKSSASRRFPRHSNVQISNLKLINLFIIVFILLVIYCVWQNNK